MAILITITFPMIIGARRPLIFPPPLKLIKMRIARSFGKLTFQSISQILFRLYVQCLWHLPF